MRLSKMKLADLISLNPEEMAKLTRKQYFYLEKKLQSAVKRRLNVINKHGMTSHAFERYLGGEIPELSVQTATRQSLQHKTVKMQEFLKAKTSSYTGLKKIQKEEEKRIFGSNDGFNTEDERRRFWSAYMEFKNQNPALMYGQGASTRLQQFLGRETFWRSRGYTADDLNNLVNSMLSTGGVDIRARAGREVEV